MASNESTYHELASYSSDHDVTIESNEENRVKSMNHLMISSALYWASFQLT